MYQFDTAELNRELLNGRHEFVLEYLYKINYKWLTNVATRIIGNTFSSDDIVQDAFLCMWYKMGNREIEFDHVLQIRKYMLMFVTNKSYDVYNRGKMYVNIFDDQADKDMFDDIATAQYMRTLNGIINDNIKYFPTQLKKVLLGTYLDGLDMGQLSKKLNMNRSALKTQKARAVELLTALLNGEDVNFQAKIKAKAKQQAERHNQAKGFKILRQRPRISANKLSNLIRIDLETATVIKHRFNILREAQIFNKLKTA